MERLLRSVADGMIILVGVVVLGVIGIRYLPFLQPPTEQAVGTRLDPATVGIDFGAGQKTLIMALQSDCGFCQQSMPFYRRLLGEDAAATQVVIAVPPHDDGIRDYLASERVKPDVIAFVERGALPVAGTPTLLLVDSQGLITHAWVGLLNDAGEAEVMGALSGQRAVF